MEYQKCEASCYSHIDERLKVAYIRLAIAIQQCSMIDNSMKPLNSTAHWLCGLFVFLFLQWMIIGHICPLIVCVLLYRALSFIWENVACWINPGHLQMHLPVETTPWSSGPSAIFTFLADVCTAVQKLNLCQKIRYVLCRENKKVEW